MYTDEPLYADSEHTYKVILTDRYNNKSERMCTAKTLDDGVCFRGLSPEAFDSDANTSYKGSGAVAWSGNLVNKEVEIKYRHIGTTGLTKTYIYFKNDKNENVHYKKNQNYVTSSGTNNMQKIRVKIPEGVTKIVFNGSNTEVIDVTLVNQ